MEFRAGKRGNPGLSGASHVYYLRRDGSDEIKETHTFSDDQGFPSLLRRGDLLEHVNGDRRGTGRGDDCKLGRRRTHRIPHGEVSTGGLSCLPAHPRILDHAVGSRSPPAPKRPLAGSRPLPAGRGNSLMPCFGPLPHPTRPRASFGSPRGPRSPPPARPSQPYFGHCRPDRDARGGL